MRKPPISTALPLLFFTPLIIRAAWAQLNIYHDTAAPMLGAVQVLAHDAPIFFGMGLLLYLSFHPRILRPAAVCMRLIVVPLYGIYLLDLFLLANFNTHLTVGDVFKYASYAWTYIGQLYPYLLLFLVGLALFAMLALYVVLTRRPIIRTGNRWPYGVALALLLVLPVLRSDGAYVHGWRYQNVLEYNLTVLSEAKAYSSEFAETVTAERQPTCSAHTPRRRNIIVVMVESLSAYQSQFFSGLNDWTPHLDAIARKHAFLADFFANGFTTEDGEIALLTGRLPIYGPASFTNWGGTRFRGFFQLPDALPQVLNRQGYHTEYITSADLAFADTGPWARSIGFDDVEGHDHPFYNTWPRYQFQAAPDEALYQRVVERVNQNLDDAPFFMFVKTAGTHHPFIDPKSGRRSARDAFINADRQLGRFYENLVATGFLKSGLLIITGDHRAMVPLGRGEIERFGAWEAAARIPLVVVSENTEGRIDGAFQQTDLYNSITNMVSTSRCTTPWLGDFLNTPGPPRYIGIRRGDRRDQVTVLSPRGPVQIRLAGDETRIVGDIDPAPSEKNNIIRHINHIRIAGDINQRKFATDPGEKPQRRFSSH